MGQVCGRVQNSNNQINEEREWISVEEQERRFRIHKLVDVYLGLGSEYIRHELFDHQIAHLIADYGKMDESWAKACRLIDQDKVPAFPEEHMFEIGDPDSVFYLTPAGSIKRLQQILSCYVRNVLGITYQIHPLMFVWNAYLVDGDIDFTATSQDATWVSMKKTFLPGSPYKNYREQKALAQEIGIAIPSLQTVAKILLLDNAVQLSNAIQQDEDMQLVIQFEKRAEIAKRIKHPLLPLETSTFVKEKFNGRRLFIACFRDPSFMIISSGNRGSRCEVNGVMRYNTGLAVVREF